MTGNIMNDFVAEPIKLIKELANESHRKNAAVAYVTRNHALFAQGDLLICDASDRAIVSRATSRELLQELVENGVSVFSFEHLHSKMIVFDHARLFVGSANFSQFAEHRIESGIVTSDAKTVSDAEKFIFQLTDVGIPVDANFLKRIFQLKLSSAKLPPLPARLQAFTSKATKGELDVSHWLFKGTRTHNAKTQAVADELQANWESSVDEPTAGDFGSEIPDGENPLWFAALRHNNKRWSDGVKIGDKVYWCYEDEEWGWIVLPERTVVSTEVMGKALLAGTEGRYLDDENSIALETFLEHMNLPSNASLRQFKSSDPRVVSLRDNWNELID